MFATLRMRPGWLLLTLFVCLVTISLAGISISHAEFSTSRSLNDQLFETVSLRLPSDVRILLEKGADPNARNSENRLPLTVAIERRDEYALEIARLLVDSGARINLPEDPYNQPLLAAVRNEQLDVVGWLLESGADVYAKDDFGNTPWDLALLTENNDLVQLVKEGIEKAERHKAYLRSKAYFKKLIQKFSYLNCANEYTEFMATDNAELTNEQKEALKERVLKQRKVIDKLAADIQQRFIIKRVRLQGIARISRETFRKQMEDYVSASYRKEMGIGSNDDLQQRCQKIADHWELYTPENTSKEEEFLWK